MLKKFLKEFHLPTHIALSFSFFLASIVFALCFGNPSWNYYQADGSTSNYENIGATSSFAFVFGFWFLFDCFCYFEKDMKDKTRSILTLISDLGPILSILVIYTVFMALRSGFVVDWIYFLSFFILEGLSCFAIYLRYRGRGEKPLKAEIYIACGAVIASLIFSIIFSFTSDYRSIFLFLILLVVALGLIALEFFLAKNHKKSRFLDEKGGQEKGLFIILSSAPMSVSFLPIWVYSYKSYGEGYSSMWFTISFIYLLFSLAIMIASFIGEIVIKKRSMRNTARTIISSCCMFLGVLGVVLTTVFFGNGTYYPEEACYYMIAVGTVIFIFGVLSFLYQEIRRTNREPRPE